MKDVFGVEFKVEPGPPLGNHPCGIEKLSAGMAFPFIMGEEHSGTLMHLTDNHSLGSVHDERTSRSHQWKFTQINILLFYITDVFDVRTVIFFPDDEPQCRPDGTGISHSSDSAILNTVFRIT